MNPLSQSTPVTNLLVPLQIESMTPGPDAGTVIFGVDLRKQYYVNANMEFKVPEPTCLRMKYMPIYTALRRTDGVWKEIYDQDRHFQKIGEVTESPAWDVSTTDQRRLLKTSIEASLDMQFYDFVKSVRDRFMESHDAVLEISGKSFVQSGYPKIVDDVRQYGDVDFELISFDAIYIVPKGGPSGTRYLA